MKTISGNKLVIAEAKRYYNSVIILSRSDTDSEWVLEYEIKPNIDTDREFIFGTDLYLNYYGSRLYVEFTIAGVALTAIYTRDTMNGKWDTPNLEYKPLKDLNIGS